jgi:predicted nucleic acid-binding protein
MNCPDSSIALKWLLAENDSDAARQLLRDWTLRSEALVAPYLLHGEMTNLLHQKVRNATLSFDQARTLLTHFERIQIDFRSPPGLFERALVLANRFSLAAAYDPQYLALCEITGATFWTADDRLYNAVAGALPFVRRLADYQPR